jgi:hypothetical protein
MNIYGAAIKHMIRWGFLGGAGLGALYGTLLIPFFGTIFGCIYGGGVGLVLGVSSGIWLGFISRRSWRLDADALDYGWTVGVSIAIFAFMGAWLMFSRLFGGVSNLFIPGIPALVASLTLAYGSKRFAVSFYYVYREIEKPKRDEKPKRSEIALQ